MDYNLVGRRKIKIFIYNIVIYIVAMLSHLLDAIIYFFVKGNLPQYPTAVVVWR